MRPIVLVGRPSKLDQWNESSERDEEQGEWTRYNAYIGFLAGLYTGPKEGWSVNITWVDNKLYLVPHEWTDKKQGGHRPLQEEAVREALERDAVETRFQWDDDPEAPMRIGARAVFHYISQQRETVRKAMDLLEEI